ncbi:alpha/beta hydrolase [Hymenobacter sp. BT188]|uniref:alpha/beta fold hydrolase n=1 Tax=Hymenobacter sp. BT188 TaxID=2763504 RepID=UPI0016516B56|nr:alpha/beta hydrolase [Hymenobacter sp. BT188]MBC6605277.1 alpha/beta hydrolase [Hymenobacter sp. BT188]
MLHLKIFLATIVAIFFLFSCSTSNKKSQAVYQTKFVSGSTNNKIEILDFGGTGEPVLFLSGLGNSAHVFIDFAPKFCDKFHVYAMTRRGFGASEQTTNGYRIDTLAMDILAVTKALNLDKVILIGHSIAGEEISKFSSTYPEKVAKVVYLDAAYDRSSIITTIMPYAPASPIPTANDSSSFENLKVFAKKTTGVSMPDDEMKSTMVFSKDGKYQKDVTPGEIQGKIISGIERPNYTSISCPALAIYSIAGSIHTVIPFYNSLDSLNKKKADICYTMFGNLAREQIALFEKEVRNGVTKEIKGANHYVFISNPVETENLIWEFLK